MIVFVIILLVVLVMVYTAVQTFKEFDGVDFSAPVENPYKKYRLTIKESQYSSELQNLLNKKNILHYLKDGELHTAADVGIVCGISPQRASALLRQLAYEEKVVKVTDKRRVYYGLV